MRTLQIIIASTRPGRAGGPVADWVHGVALKHGGFDPVELVDLAEWDLPLMNEPHHPRLRRYQHRHTKDWSAQIDRADAFVIVMPEYNYGYTAPLKNALDYLNQEWAYKPVGLVSYGGVAGGSRAAQMIKQVLTTLKMMPMYESVPVPHVAQSIGADGVFRPTAAVDTGTVALLDELVRWTDALAPLRQESRAWPAPQEQESRA